jgi:DsbC/DsbD-like thiol-disulfide interchange protein
MMGRTESLRLAVAACAFASIAGTATAADSSRWDGDAKSAIRLIAGNVAAGDATIRAGIEIRLKPGWHTYWRYPGDAGIPPRFDFAGSQNVKSVEVHWPAPKRQPEGSIMTIGYDRDVILPLAIVPQDPAKPVLLRLKLEYGVCEKLCAPAEGRAELKIAPGASKLEPQLAAAERLVPKQRTLGKGEGLVVRSVRRENEPKPHVVVDVAAPPGTKVDLFAEGPTPEWALPVPAPASGAPDGLNRFTFDLDGGPPGADYQHPRLTLTAVADREAVEVTTRLD